MDRAIFINPTSIWTSVPSNVRVDYISFWVCFVIISHVRYTDKRSFIGPASSSHIIVSSFKQRSLHFYRGNIRRKCGRPSTTLSAGTLLPHCCYSASYLTALFCASAVTGSPYTNCYLTEPRLLCGWTDGLEWSPGCIVWPTVVKQIFLRFLYFYIKHAV